MEDQVKSGCFSLPKGCYITLEKVAQTKILDNINKAVNNKKTLTEKVRTFTDDSGRSLTLANFLDYYSIPPRELYSKNLSFSQLKALAGIMPGFDEPAQDEVKKALLLRGIDASRIEVEVKGDADPVGDNSTYEGRIANNRVSINVQ